MAKVINLVRALRVTAQRLSGGARYEWGHMGRCNAGHLLQTVAGMTDVEIAESVDHQLEEWTEHARGVCAQTGTPVDALFDVFRSVGFEAQDVVNLENLSDRRVLKRLPRDKRYLRRHDVSDVCLYMRELADLIEEEAA